MRRRIMALAVAAAIATAGAGARAQDAAADAAAIDAVWRSYAMAWLTGDAELWLGLWDEAGLQMPPGAPARGVDALRAAVPQAMAGETVTSFDIRPEETVVAGDWAWSRGVYDMKGEAEGRSYHVDGKFLTILRRQPDGAWRIYRDAFNSNVP